MDVFEYLAKAADENRTVQIAYHGGSRPGTVREIVPRKVTHLEVLAIDLASHRTKTFKLERIEPIEAGVDFVPPAPPTKEPESLKMGVGLLVTELEGLGWYVELDDEHASVHEYFKNGNPKKGAFASIWRFTDNKARPWYVSSKELVQTRCYGSLGKAIALFMDHARRFAPTPRADR